MAFAGNGGLVVGGRALGASFAHAERQDGGPEYQKCFEHAVTASVLKESVPPVHVNEGEGDLLTLGESLLAGYGFRTDLRAHTEAQELFGLPVVSLRLIDPRFFDPEALAVLDDRTVAYYPGAFSERSRDVLRRLFPNALIALRVDAEVLGLNAVSDGFNVLLSAQALGLANKTAHSGFNPIGVDVSDLL